MCPDNVGLRNSRGHRAVAVGRTWRLRGGNGFPDTTLRPVNLYEHKNSKWKVKAKETMRGRRRRKTSKNIILCSCTCMYYTRVCTRDRKRRISYLPFGWYVRAINLLQCLHRTSSVLTLLHIERTNRHFLKIHTRTHASQRLYAWLCNSNVAHALISFLLSPDRAVNIYNKLYYYKVTGVGGQHD